MYNQDAILGSRWFVNLQNIRVESGTLVYSSASEGSNQYIFGVAAGRSAQAPESVETKPMRDYAHLYISVL